MTAILAPHRTARAGPLASSGCNGVARLAFSLSASANAARPLISSSLSFRVFVNASTLLPTGCSFRLSIWTRQIVQVGSMHLKLRSVLFQKAKKMTAAQNWRRCWLSQIVGERREVRDRLGIRGGLKLNTTT